MFNFNECTVDTNLKIVKNLDFYTTSWCGYKVPYNSNIPTTYCGITYLLKDGKNHVQPLQSSLTLHALEGGKDHDQLLQCSLNLQSRMMVGKEPVLHSVCCVWMEHTFPAICAIGLAPKTSNQGLTEQGKLQEGGS